MGMPFLRYKYCTNLMERNILLFLLSKRISLLFVVGAVVVVVVCSRAVFTCLFAVCVRSFHILCIFLIRASLFALTTPRVFHISLPRLILILNILSTYYDYLAGGEGCSKLSISCSCFVLLPLFLCCLSIEENTPTRQVCCQCNLILCPRFAALFRGTYDCVYAPLNDPQIVIRRSGRIACRNSFLTHKM